MEKTIETLGKLREAANEAIEDSKLIPATYFAGCAINWGDLRCVRVYHWDDDSGDSGYTIEIEEASPDSYYYHAWIVEKVIEKTGIQDISVTTEW